MSFKVRSLDQLAELICGNAPASGQSTFVYRSSSYLTQFFEDIDTDFKHDESTRSWWVKETLTKILDEPWPSPHTPPDTFTKVIQRLMDPTDATDNDLDRSQSLNRLNEILSREGYEAFRAEDKQYYLRHVATNAVSQPGPNPHRPFSQAEVERRQLLAVYLESCSEDELIQSVLLPLYRQLGYHRITAAGHRDKALEYGKDVWMKYTLPTQHVLYFGIQAKKDKLDSAGMTKSGNANLAEIYQQVLMMLGHEIFDPEIGKRVLVDHAFIVAGGEITKAARNWIGNKLDQTKRSQILFMDREDILNLYVVTNLPLPAGAIPPPSEVSIGEIPF
ncbi:hypothetical protein PlfCFBP13513_17005 [Plantibacter flavus]|uniref:hypothetical protein n=1 Tax=Plantibacter flavus TaxID=150123 RepID=UPI0010C1D73C|nr:hypothetical protein [Plantibacter flavus]TKJ95526.1 hypothetical protein PlfCFBP13513_17005 [Plantibacter flavus]